MSIRDYWLVRVSADRQELTGAAADMRRIIETTSIPLGDPRGEPESEPLFEDDGFEGVFFNGIAPFSREAFLWPIEISDYLAEGGVFCLEPLGDWAQGWTATNFLVFDETGPAYPGIGTTYGTVVKACLLAAKQHLGDDILLQSDWDLDEWRNAATLYEEALDEPPPWPPWTSDEERRWNELQRVFDEG